jgi:predicted ArsR family transcriptional regulator
LRRISRALAAGYAPQIQGDTPSARLQSLADLLNQRRIPVSVGMAGNHATLTAHACPYPTLAEHDQSVCQMEKMMFSELIGNDVALTKCRLDGDRECQFQTDG